VIVRVLRGAASSLIEELQQMEEGVQLEAQ
jgi:hypothetical protein